MRILTLGEGNTPVVESVSHSEGNHGRLLFKLESSNPTGSYKDRFAAAEVQRIIDTGGTGCMATSSGNTGSALATYCARAGLKCVIVVNQEAPDGKLLQMRAHGAQVIRVPGFVTDASITRLVFEQLQQISQQYSIPLVVSAFAFCPEGMRGVERIAAELVPHRPDHVFVPVGGGGLYSAVAQGFLKQTQSQPRVHAVQPSGCLTLVGAYLDAVDVIPIPDSTTRISGLSVPSNLDAGRGLALLRRCNGLGIAVDDQDVFEAQQHLFTEEGIYCEPAGATAYAGWRKMAQRGLISPNETSICLVTGHGFKDPSSVERAAQSNPVLTFNPSDLSTQIIHMLGPGGQNV